MKTPEKMPVRTFYDRRRWGRGEAWWNLLKQQIPGCPVVLTEHGFRNCWRKSHTGTHWSWRYVEAGNAAKEPSE